MLMMVTAAIGFYVTAALLVRAPRILNVTLATVIAAALYRRHERCGDRLWVFAAAGGHWVREARTQRALNRATRAVISLTAHATSSPIATHHAVEFMRRARQR